MLKEVYATSGSFLAGIRDEAKQLFDDGISSYLFKHEENFKSIKTILHRHEPVSFYDIYFPAKLEKRNKDRSHGSVIETYSINKVFWNTRFITVTGDAGSGKSTLIKHLFLNSIHEKFNIPILIQLRELNESNNNLYLFIKEKIINYKLAKNSEIFERLLEEGKFVFLLDGYDEVQSKHKNKVINSINEFVERFDKNRFIITTHPFTNLEVLPKFHNYYIKDLTKTDIPEFIDKQKIQPNLAMKIKDSIDESDQSYIKTYLTNSLLLTLYIVTYSTNSSIPENKSMFYRRVFEVLYREHDSASKIGFDREFTSNLYQEQFEEILKTFSLITFFESKYTFDRGYAKKKLLLSKNIAIEKNKSFPNFDINKFIDDLKTAIGIWVEDSGILSFVHRSMQEYFAAYCIESTNTNKNITYSKILDRLASSSSSKIKVFGSDIENFMSLCKEMDTYNYIKYIEIPILKEIISIINKRSFPQKMRAILTLTLDMIFMMTKKRPDIHNEKFDLSGFNFAPFRYLMFTGKLADIMIVILDKINIIQTDELLSLYEPSPNGSNIKEFVFSTKNSNNLKFDWLTQDTKKKLEIFHNLLFTHIIDP